MKHKHILTVVIVACAVAYLPVASAGLFDNITSGIANAFDFSKKKIEAYHQTTDKQLVDQFYFLSEDGKEEGMKKDILLKTKAFEFQKLTPSSLTVRQLMYREGNLQSVMQAMSSYNYSPMDDEIGQRYVAFAQSRGNVVKLYKPALGALLNQMFAQNFYLQHDKNTTEWIGVDNVLIEYSSNGQIVSVMTRAHQAIVNFGVESYQYINFYFGAGNVQFIENRMANSNFDNNFIRVVTSPQSPVPVVQAAKAPETVAEAPVQAEIAKPSSSTTPERRIQLLKELSELKKAGVLSDQEFTAEKRKLLDN